MRKIAFMRAITFGLVPLWSSMLFGQQPPVISSNPCDCCGKKPTVSQFTGQIAIATQQAGNAGTSPWFDRVLMIWDLKNQSGAPLDTRWFSGSFPPTQAYSHADWSVSKLGDVFGLTLDAQGNIYVAATRVYGSASSGSLSTGTANQKAGQIYKLDKATGAPSAFAQLPNNGTGLGNITYDCGSSSFFVSNFTDGLIYRLSSAGTTQSTWDHGLNLPSAIDSAGMNLGRLAVVGSDGSSQYAALGSPPVGSPSLASNVFTTVYGAETLQGNLSLFQTKYGPFN